MKSDKTMSIPAKQCEVALSPLLLLATPEVKPVNDPQSLSASRVGVQECNRENTLCQHDRVAGNPAIESTSARLPNDTVASQSIKEQSAMSSWRPRLTSLPQLPYHVQKEMRNKRYFPRVLSCDERFGKRQRIQSPIDTQGQASDDKEP